MFVYTRRIADNGEGVRAFGCGVRPVSGVGSGDRAGYNAGMDIVLVGIGLGLASLAGVRAFLLPALSALFAALGVFDLAGAGIAVNEWALFGVLMGLAVVEIVMDKVQAIERVFNWIMVPIRVASGALLFGLASGVGLGADAALWLVAGGVVAGVVAVLKVVLRPPARDASSGVSTSFLSLVEDAIGLVGGVLASFVPYLPVLLVGFLLFFYARIRKRRGRKFGGLRILGD